MSALRKNSLMKSEIHQINLAQTEYAEIILTDSNGKEVAKIAFERDVETTPQMIVTYFNDKGNVTQSVTTYDIDA